jgi:peptidoglycan-associated lipoprotein
MHFRILSLFAAVLLVAACQTKPTTTAGGESTGGVSAHSGAQGDVISGSVGMDQQIWLSTNIGDRVNFALDKYNIDQAAATRLERQAIWLKENPEVTVTIEGNCDERGTREYNLGLGDRRANAVKNYLVALGVDASRVSTLSFGKENPMALGSNEDAWAQNRNAQTVVY